MIEQDMHIPQSDDFTGFEDMTHDSVIEYETEYMHSTEFDLDFND